MKYKALMIDLDGTTVPPFTNDISARVVERVRQAHDFVNVCLVTGRPLSETTYLIDEMEITGPCVLSNGAQIYDPVEKTVLRQLNVDRKQWPTIYEEIKKRVDHFIVYDGLTEHPDSQWEECREIVSFYAPDISPEIVQEIAKAIESVPDVTTNRMLGLRPGREAIEVVNAKATKQYGIYEVAKILQIQTHEIIGVGDSYNDFPLLMASGLKVAMGNAVPELKAIADYIAPSVYEDGMATIIEKFVLPS